MRKSLLFYEICFMLEMLISDRVAFVVFFLLPSLPLSAQIGGNVVPPSPNAQELLRFGEYPVSLHTGVPQIQIPIYTIKLKDFSLPISIDYNASGIKVEQESGTVGLGWALNAGGVINHKIRGYYDFYDSYYLDTAGDEMSDILGIYNLKSAVILGYKNELPFTPPQNMNKTELFRRLTNGCLDYGSIDFSPDLFSYVIPGYYGKFIFAHDHSVIKEKFDNVIITPIRNMGKRGKDYLSSFILTDPAGNKYYFEQTERAYNPDRPACYGGDYNSSYYLTKIMTPAGSQIIFKYKKYGTLLGLYNKHATKSSANNISIDYTYYDNFILDEMSFPGGELKFSYKYDRTDLPNHARLDKIELTGDGVQMQWNFVYGYFFSTANTKEVPTLADLNKIVSTGNYTEDWNKKRLKLVSLEQVSGNENQTCSFQYSENNLPTKLSSAQDHWGYFNNAQNTYLIPTVSHNESQDVKSVVIKSYGFGADRECHDTSNQAFILTRITYPTGGSRFFSFEPNTYRADVFENDPYKKDFFYSKINKKIVEGEYAHNIGGDWVDTAKVKLPAITSGGLAQYDVRIKVTLDNSYNQAKAANKIMYFRIVRNGTVQWTFEYKNPYAPSTITESTRVFEKKWSGVTSQAGNYVMEVYGPMRSYIQGIEFELSSLSSPESYLANPVKNGGGLRIAQIVTFDKEGSYLYHKKFRYNEGGVLTNTDKVTGKLMEYPRYLMRDGDAVAVTLNGIRDEGYSVGYSEVSVIDYDKSGSITGKETSKFVNVPNRNLFYSWDNTSLYGDVSHNGKDINPPGIEPYRNPNNGDLLETVRYEYKNNRFIPVKKNCYKYSGLGGGPMIYWGVKKDFDESVQTCVDDDTYKSIANSMQGTSKKIPTGYLYPALIPYQSFLSKETETLYYGSDSITKVTSYSHNNFHQIASKTISIGKDNDIYEFRYPTDFGGDAVMESLVSANRINTPVRVSNTVNGKERYTEWEYELYGGVPQVSRVTANTGNSGSMETHIEYTRYDSHGNVLEMISSDGTSTVYLWSYTYQYPVAEIRNASYDDVIAALGMSAENLGAMSTPPMQQVNGLRSKLSRALVTTYTYYPLAGMRTVTDPQGVTRTFEVDGAGRLSRVKDQYGNVVETFGYHYNK